MKFWRSIAYTYCDVTKNSNINPICENFNFDFQICLTTLHFPSYLKNNSTIFSDFMALSKTYSRLPDNLSFKSGATCRHSYHFINTCWIKGIIFLWTSLSSKDLINFKLATNWLAKCFTLVTYVYSTDRSIFY